MTAIKVRLDGLVGIHRRVTVFAGEDAEHLANCGRLTMREAEAQDLLALIELGERMRQQMIDEGVERGDDLSSVAVEIPERKIPQAPQNQDWDDEPPAHEGGWPAPSYGPSI